MLLGVKVGSVSTHIQVWECEPTQQQVCNYWAYGKASK